MRKKLTYEPVPGADPELEISLTQQAGEKMQIKYRARAARVLTWQTLAADDPRVPEVLRAAGWRPRGT